MKDYPIASPDDYKYYIKHYREAMAEGREENLFLGIDPKDRVLQRTSQEVDKTDLWTLIKFCLFPLYVEGDRDIARRTEEILKGFAKSTDLLKLDRVCDYIFIEHRSLSKYKSVPFWIDIKALVPLILDSVDQLTEAQKEDELFDGVSGTLKVVPEFRAFDQERVDAIVEAHEVRKSRRKPLKPASEVYPVVLDTTSIDAIGIVDGHLELLLLDSNHWYSYTEHDHLLKLQEKINNYIHYLESKQYVAQYGDQFDKKVINITFKYSPSDNGLAFLVQVQKALQHTDMSLTVVFPDEA